ncbi:MAG: alginate lyase family protein [Anaerolineales bacterium]|nr:alginate lyase family protein [Anaerolineales bacterium]
MNRTHWLQRIAIGFKAARQLGWAQVSAYALYEFGLRSGHYRRVVARQTRTDHLPEGAFRLESPLPPPDRQALLAAIGKEGLKRLREEANEIVAGKARLFGGPARPLLLDPPAPPLPWTAYAHGELSGAGSETTELEQDIKFTWEAARMGWAYTLARAYTLTGDERYPASFWERIEAFLQANPPGVGLHWASAQEVAMRLIALAFAWHAMRGSTHTARERVLWLGRAIAAHAGRIPPTLVYARAQRNNHLLAEAAGLYTASIFLPEHPQARRWQLSGWRWLVRGLLDQIAPDGTYIQHSANYHRLMLQLAVWSAALSACRGEAFPPQLAQRLATATCWLLALIDPATGQAPNLGPNDSADLQPLSACPPLDYRPVLQAAGRAFLGRAPFPPGTWDEQQLWLCSGMGALSSLANQTSTAPDPEASPHVLRVPRRASWAYLRAARFISRPGHADQLHVDLWWRGINLARDAGTYRYAAPLPWDNALAGAGVHNTLIINGEEPMLRAGRFLWLDWSQARLLARESDARGGWERLVAEQDGYRRLGVLHQRSLTAFKDGGYVVEDRLLPVRSQDRSLARAQVTFQVALHWLLPDWKWELLELEDGQVQARLRSSHGWVTLTIAVRAEQAVSFADLPLEVQVLRAGELVYGSGTASPILGWYAPYYGCKEPALSLRALLRSPLPITLSSTWAFPK